MSDFMEIISGFLPSAQGVGNMVMWIFAPILIGLVLFFGLWLQKQPKRYKGILFERTNSGWITKKITILRYIHPKAKFKGFYYNKIKQTLKLSDAYISGKKIVFYVQNFNNHLVSMNINESINCLDDTEKGKKILINEFIGETKLEELDGATVESLDKDVQKLKWVDKYGGYIAAAAQITASIVMIVMIVYAVRKTSEVTQSIEAVTIEVGGLREQYVSIAESFEKIAEGFGGYSIPPG